MSSVTFWILDILLVLITSLLIHLSLVSLSHTLINRDLFRIYLDNWGSGLVEDIVISSDSLHCPPMFRPLLNVTFPGNIEGCDCFYSKVVGLRGNYFPYACEQFHMDQGCVPILSHNNTEVHLWRKTLICAKYTSKDYFDYQLSFNTTGMACMEGTQQCGYLDTENHKLCIPNNQECPINEIQIKQKDPQLDKDNKYVKLPLNQEPYYIYFSNQFTQNPVLSTITASLNGLCANSLDGRIGENHYILNDFEGSSQCVTKIDNSTYDPRPQLVDSYKLGDFYRDNHLLDIISTLPFYPRNFTITNAVLQKSNYFGINSHCFGNKIFEINKLLLVDDTRIDDLSNNIYIASIMLIVYCVVLFLYLILYKIWYSEFLPKTKIVFSIDIFNTCALVAILVFCFIAKNDVNILTDPYYQFLWKGCGDTITQNALDFAYEPLLRVTGFLVPMIALNMIVLSLIIINYIVFFILNEEGLEYIMKY